MREHRASSCLGQGLKQSYEASCAASIKFSRLLEADQSVRYGFGTRLAYELVDCALVFSEQSDFWNFEAVASIPSKALNQTRDLQSESTDLPILTTLTSELGEPCHHT